MSSNIDEFIAKKVKEFEIFICKIYKEIDLRKLEFKIKIEELRRQHTEKEREHERQLKIFEEICHSIDNACKNNDYSVQHCRRELLKKARSDMRVFEQLKQTPRMTIEFTDGLINNFPNLFTVEYVKQPDYMKKKGSLRRIRGDKSGLSIVSGCDYDSEGTMYFADYGNDQIQVVTKTGELLQPLRGVSGPWGLKVSKGLVFVTERDTGKLKILSTEGKTKVTKTLCERGKNHENETSIPLGVDVDTQGRVYIADSGLGKVHILSSNRYRNKVGEIQHECLKNPQDVKVVGDRVYVLDAAEKLVKVFNKDGELVESLLTKKRRSPSPQFFTVDRLGNMLICFQKEKCIEIYDDQETPFHELSCPSIPGGIALRKNGEVIVSCSGDDEICTVF